jgi:hypothetical protein
MLFLPHFGPERIMRSFVLFLLLTVSLPGEERFVSLLGNAFVEIVGIDRDDSSLKTARVVKIDAISLFEKDQYKLREQDKNSPCRYLLNITVSQSAQSSDKIKIYFETENQRNLAYAQFKDIVTAVPRR